MILDLSTYKQMLVGQDDPDVLHGMSEVELTALAESTLTLGNRQELQSLQDKNEADALSEDEAVRLDHLIEQIDQLNVLKARARYTLLSHKPLVNERLCFSRSSNRGP